MKFKLNFTFEAYLHINSSKIRSAITQLRVSSHHLQIEKGRHHKPKPIPLEERKCIYCTDNTIEDEKHFLLHCPRYSDQRFILFSLLKNHIPISVNTSDEIFKALLNLNISLSRQLGKFIINALAIRGQRNNCFTGMHNLLFSS